MLTIGTKYNTLRNHKEWLRSSFAIDMKACQQVVYLHLSTDKPASNKAGFLLKSGGIQIVSEMPYAERDCGTTIKKSNGRHRGWICCYGSNEKYGEIGKKHIIAIWYAYNREFPGLNISAFG